MVQSTRNGGSMNIEDVNVEYGINECPWCKSQEIDQATESEYSHNQYYDKSHCKICGKKWWELYTLTGIEEIVT